MFRKQKPLRSIRDEVYDASMKSSKKQELREAYDDFFNTIDKDQAKELRKMLR